jgi:acylphosphatase
MSRGIDMEKIRAHILISGRVQGVFFRDYTQRAAQERGRVEAVLEGEKEKVEDMIRWCHQGSPHSRVTEVSVDWEVYTGEFKDFSVKYFY